MVYVYDAPIGKQMILYDNTRVFRNEFLQLVYLEGWLLLTNPEGKYVAACFTAKTDRNGKTDAELVNEWIAEFKDLNREETLIKLKKYFFNEIAHIEGLYGSEEEIEQLGGVSDNNLEADRKYRVVDIAGAATSLFT